MTIAIKKYLQGGDLRSKGKVDELLPHIKDQKDFDALFNYLGAEDRLIRMRAIDAIEKISKSNVGYLAEYKTPLIKFMNVVTDKEFKWHLALLACRMRFRKDELDNVWQVLSNWVENKHESKIVRVNALQALFELSRKNEGLDRAFEQIVLQLEKEDIPSLKARIRKITSGYK